MNAARAPTDCRSSVLSPSRKKAPEESRAPNSLPLRGVTNMLPRLSSTCALIGAVSLATSGAAFAACTGPGAPSNTETKCLTAVQIPGVPLRSYDISWVNPHRGEYYLADRSNSGIDIIDTRTLTFKRTLGKGLF